MKDLLLIINRKKEKAFWETISIKVVIGIGIGYVLHYAISIIQYRYDSLSTLVALHSMAFSLVFSIISLGISLAIMSDTRFQMDLRHLITLIVIKDNLEKSDLKNELHNIANGYVPCGQYQYFFNLLPALGLFLGMIIGWNLNNVIMGDPLKTSSSNNLWMTIVTAILASIISSLITGCIITKYYKEKEKNEQAIKKIEDL